MKLHQLRGNDPFLAPHPTAQITQHQTRAAQHIGLLGELKPGPEHLPKRMTAQKVVLLPVVETRAQLARPSRSHLPMVIKYPLRVGARRPPLHSGRGHCDPVDASAPDRHVTSDVLEALAPKELT